MLENIINHWQEFVVLYTVLALLAFIFYKLGSERGFHAGQARVLNQVEHMNKTHYLNKNGDWIERGKI